MYFSNYWCESAKVCVCAYMYVWSQLKWSKHIWAFKQVVWVFSIFYPTWTYLDGWETDALVSLVDLIHLFLQHHCLLSQVLQTLWALLGAVVPLPQLKTAQTPSLSELSLVWSCPSSSLKHSTKRWWCLWPSWIHIAQTLSLCRYFKNQAHFGPIMQPPHPLPAPPSF